jgi:hypothetical protein
MATTNRGAVNGRVSGGADASSGRLRLASPATAAVLGVLSLLSAVLLVVLEFLVPEVASPTGTVSVVAGVAWFVFGVTFTAVGVVVARREPGNPMGWLLIGEALAVQVGSDAPAYAYFDYKTHHGALPLGPLAVLLSGAWSYGFLIVPLIILLFPDGRPAPRWRWPLRGYLTVAAVFIAGTLVLAVADLRLSVPVDGSGNLIGLNQPTSVNSWFAPLFYAGFLSCFVLSIAVVVYQTRRYRRASGERRQQLKWLGAGGFVCVAFFLTTVLWSHAPAIFGDLFFPLALTALPVTIGVGILKYRLYEIDRLVSRTLSYAILTALLAGTFVGLIVLSTDVLAISSRVGVAASTLAAAALFNPLRKRIQHLVDRRFNRARYDAEATVAAFTARLRDAVEIDAIRADLLDVVNRAVQPTHASVWIRPPG